jgi:hypothetical protein
LARNDGVAEAAVFSGGNDNMNIRRPKVEFRDQVSAVEGIGILEAKRLMSDDGGCGERIPEGNDNVGLWPAGEFGDQGGVYVERFTETMV